MEAEMMLALGVAPLVLRLLAAAPAESVPALLQRQSQELADALGAGSAAVWERYLDPDVRYVDETGEIQRKKELVEDVRPFPPGISGSIRILDYEAAVHGDTAFATYVNDENEDYHGARLHCQYRTTETWVKRPEGWRLIGAQVLAMRTDPPAVAISAERRREYAGKYALTPDLAYEIRADGDALQGQQTGRKPEALQAEAPDVLFVPGKPRYRYVLLRDAQGRITGLAQRREAWDLVWKRVE
jgi:ketosteroid isomerase-like protein